jgi:hypothetical protein
MGEAARVDSIDVFKDFKIALWKFQEAATTALGDAESEMGRVLMWLQTEQDSYWKGQIRKREEIVARCKEAVRMKTVFKDATGRQQSAIEEQKALKIALQRLEEAQQKLVLVRKWARLLPKEIEMYKGSVQRFATTVQSEIPNAAAHLEKLAQKLDGYMSVQSAGFGDSAGGIGSAPSGPSMSRGGVALAPVAPDELERLEQQIPGPEVRAAAPVIPDVDLDIPVIPTEQRAPAVLPVVERRELLPGARVFVAKVEAGPGRTFLYHAKPVNPDDSGWSVAPADAGPDLAWQAVPAGDLLKSRPDLVDLLGLPVGFSVIIDSAGIFAVIDAQRQSAWRRG